MAWQALSGEGRRKERGRKRPALPPVREGGRRRKHTHTTSPGGEEEKPLAPINNIIFGLRGKEEEGEASPYHPHFGWQALRGKQHALPVALRKAGGEEAGRAWLAFFPCKTHGRQAEREERGESGTAAFYLSAHLFSLHTPLFAESGFICAFSFSFLFHEEKGGEERRKALCLPRGEEMEKERGRKRRESRREQPHRRHGGPGWKRWRGCFCALFRLGAACLLRCSLPV